MRIIGIINWNVEDKDRKREGEKGEVRAVANANLYYSPSSQPKTTTNKLSNPKDASNIHSPHHHYHIGYPHHWESPLVTLVRISCS